MVMLVSEIFDGIQGEGPLQGKPATFIRFSGCNLSCSWCDTKYHKDNPKTASPHDIAIEINHDLVVITGGEPFVQDHDELQHLLQLLGQHTIQFETNGIIPPPDWLGEDIYVSVSPKLWAGFQRKTLRQWASRPRTTFKFVVDLEYDVDDILQIIRSNSILSINPIYLIAEGTDAKVIEATRHISETLLQIGPAAGLDVRVQLRQHIILYGNQRGV